MPTPLIRKLGLRAGMRACVVGAPPHYRALLGPLPGDVHWHDAPVPRRRGSFRASGASG